jgi:hypothetical protein
MKINPTIKSIGRRRPAAAPHPSPLQDYPAQPDGLTDAGGAYVVLPVTLLQRLDSPSQQQLLDLLDRLTATNPAWATTTTYQVLPWARVRPGDLEQEELAWHGITSDIEPISGTISYIRGGNTLPAETVIGHRPALDTVDSPAGTYPGARPPLLPAVPGIASPATTLPAANGLRTARAVRMIETRRRRELLFQHAPTADRDWAESVIAADPLWDNDGEWKILIDRTSTTIAATAPTEDSTAAPAPAQPGDQSPAISAADTEPVEVSTAGPEMDEASDIPTPIPAAAQTQPVETEKPPSTEALDVEADLKAFEADLQDLY